MPVNSRSKGKRGELEVVKLLRSSIGNGPDDSTIRRSFGQARDGYEQPDVIGCEKDYYVEVKRYKDVTVGKIRKWREKMMSDYVKFQKLVMGDDYDAIPLLFYRADGERVWNVHLSKEDARRLCLEDNHAVLHSDLWLSFEWPMVERALKIKKGLIVE